MSDLEDRNVRARMTHRVRKSVVSEAELRQHLQAADARQLLLCAVHITGDASLLDRYGDNLGPSAIAVLRERLGATASIDTSPPASPEVIAELTELVCRVLTREDQPEYLDVSDRALFAQMADLAAGMPIDEKYHGLLLEQCGFVPDQRAIPPTKTPPETLNLAIIGAGMAGLYAAVKASDRGFEWEVFEMEGGVGGLWWSQTYPGVAVDTPALYYSLSWEVTPEWSMFFPMGPEYRAYLTGLAEKYELLDRVRFNSEVTRMEWVESEQVWELSVLDRTDGAVRVVRAAAVITGAGHLNRPKYPELEGLDSFAGESVHTTRWRDVPLAGKRVAVIGAGAAAIQVIASITDQVEQLTVFQRQAHWVLPNMLGDANVSESERWLRKHLPYYLKWARFQSFWLAGDEFGYPVMRVDREWMQTHLMSISPENDFAMQTCLSYINDTFGEGSEMAQKLTPDFAFGGKRPVRDPGGFEPGGYYYALSQPNVGVVTSGLAQVVPEGIITADGTLHELDVIIYATGMTLDWLSPIEIIGREGVRLNDVWADDNPRSYLGGTVPGFPNLFVNDGPNTGVGHAGGHNFMAETVNHYAFECLQLLVEHGATAIEVTQEAHDLHNRALDELMQGSIWAHEHRADTYYRNGEGRIILPSPWRHVEYWEMSQSPDASRFVLESKQRVAELVGE